MTLQDFRVKPHRRIGSYESKGKRILSYVVRIPFAKYLEKKEIRIEIKALDAFGNNLKCTKAQFVANSYDVDVYARLSLIDANIEYIVRTLIENNKKLGRDLIESALYGYLDGTNKIIEILNKGFTSNPKDLDKYKGIRVLPDEPLSLEAKRKFESLNREDILDVDTGEQIDADDVMNALEVEVIEKNRQEEIEKMSITERYNKGHYDNNNLFEVMGFCLTNNPRNNSSFLSDRYRSLWVRLLEYRFIENPKEDIKDLDFDWIDKFLTYYYLNGYATARIIKYTPFNSEKYQLLIYNSKRATYTTTSFSKLVDITRYWIKTLVQVPVKLTRAFRWKLTRAKGY